MKYVLFFIITICAPVLSQATGAEGGIPLSFVLFQILNFSVFTACLFFLLRKKLPEFLQQKRKDFLDYRARAGDLEEQEQSARKVWAQKLHEIEEKEKTLTADVQKALSLLQKEVKEREDQNRQIQEQQNQRELKRVRIKELSLLKNKVLSLVMARAKAELTGRPLPARFNEQSLQKWERLQNG